MRLLVTWCLNRWNCKCEINIVSISYTYPVSLILFSYLARAMLLLGIMLGPAYGAKELNAKTFNCESSADCITNPNLFSLLAQPDSILKIATHRITAHTQIVGLFCNSILTSTVASAIELDMFLATARCAIHDRSRDVINTVYFIRQVWPLVLVILAYLGVHNDDEHHSSITKMSKTYTLLFRYSSSNTWPILSDVI